MTGALIHTFNMTVIVGGLVNLSPSLLATVITLTLWCDNPVKMTGQFLLAKPLSKDRSIKRCVVDSFRVCVTADYTT